MTPENLMVKVVTEILKTAQISDTVEKVLSEFPDKDLARLLELKNLNYVGLVEFNGRVVKKPALNKVLDALLKESLESAKSFAELKNWQNKVNLSKGD